MGAFRATGLIAFASSLDQIGPLARTVEDAALAYDAMAGYDPMDATSIDRPVEPAASALRERLARTCESASCGSSIPKALGDELDAIYERAYRDLERLGAELVEVSLPTADYGLPTYYLIAPAECSSNLARFDGVRYGLRVDGADVRAMYENTRAAGFGAEVKRRILIGTHALSSGYYDAYYVRAQKARTLIARDFERAFARCDLIACPAASSPAFRVQREERSVQHVSDGLLHDSDVAGRAARALGSVRLDAAGGRQRADADRLAALRAALRRTRSCSARRTPTNGPPQHAAYAQARARRRCARDTPRTKRSSASSATSSSRRRRKMFCGCANEFGGEPNTKVCPVCLGLPGCAAGAQRAGDRAHGSAGLAFGAEIPAFSKFDRKNYFYPDMPKDYQISQYDMPLTQGGVGAVLARGRHAARSAA